MRTARLASKRAERDEPRRRAATTLADALVVDQPATLAKHLIEQRHVLWLPLDDVREEEVPEQ